MFNDPEILKAIYLALVQGFTEFLPISSSGHLVLVPKLLGNEVQSISFDIAVHFGSLIAVVWYFRRQLATMSVDWMQSISCRQAVGESGLAWSVIWGTVPAGIFGLLMFLVYAEKFQLAQIWMMVVLVITVICLLYFLIKRKMEVVRYLLLAIVVMAALSLVAFIFKANLRGPETIAVTTLLFGLVLLVADRVGRQQREINTIGWKDVLLIGLAQAVAIIPGTSRSGITITMALFLGLKRGAAARFSFLLSIPTILLAAAVLLIKFIKSDEQINWLSIGVGTVVSALTAYLCIYLFLKLIERMGMMPFVVYRVLLAIVLAYLIYTGFFSVSSS
ncbi:Undecaprenyl-diphosphatase [hydrothermal vent metagenome]|uniref:Undecaprenyl-diphosphatase n=1 Tax=hydrothermal vent metagenome TaxID=652676 RepID=A0A3B0YIW4_9ZZZZ